MAKYWFARRRLDQPMNRRMAPVSWEGWGVALGFVAAMAVGALSFVGLSLADQPVLGIVVFVLLPALGAAAFLALAYRKGDVHHTVEDYRLGRVDTGNGGAR